MESSSRWRKVEGGAEGVRFAPKEDTREGMDEEDMPERIEDCSRSGSGAERPRRALRFVPAEEGAFRAESSNGEIP